MINAEAKELVYGEIDTRLAELEFTEPEKDLEALKQILDAIQKSKHMSGPRKEQASSLKSHTNNILGQSLEVHSSIKSNADYKSRYESIRESYIVAMQFQPHGDAIMFESEVEKIYLSTPTKIAILDHERKQTIVLRKDGLPDAGKYLLGALLKTIIPSPAEDEKKLKAHQFSQEGVSAGIKVAAITVIISAVATLITVCKIPWAKENLNHTAQALIISGEIGEKLKWHTTFLE
ncbi:monoglyceride lipase-like [Hibiscus syriacus]|uniref:Monoglyceride lipase-like n=1 Tax=Hibiscus syriacus TaxID=106335 RepID=A0A6A2XYA6_HIBSY|nr:monoglyceride lipase-like [Hibiscus syriacus]